MKPFRFWAGATEPVSAREFAERIRRAEASGFDTLVFPDHVVPQLAPVPAMAIVAALSDRLRIAPFVINNDLRHPAVLGHDLATLDLLSDGRLDRGHRRRLEQAGVRGDGPGLRPAGDAGQPPGGGDHRPEGLLRRRAVQLRAATHYTITELDGQPKPVQRPHPPFMVGGGGTRVLSLAAREAQIVGLAPRAGRDGRGDNASLVVGRNGREGRLGARGGRRAVRRRWS